MCFLKLWQILHRGTTLPFPWGWQADSMHVGRSVWCTGSFRFSPHSPPELFKENKCGILTVNNPLRGIESAHPTVSLCPHHPAPPPYRLLYCNNDLWMNATPPTKPSSPHFPDPKPWWGKKKKKTPVIFLTQILDNIHSLCLRPKFVFNYADHRQVGYAAWNVWLPFFQELGCREADVSQGK